jgi:tetratricopeptide (TPR) repeat protein
MDVCIVSHERAILLHRTIQAAPDPFLQAVAPSRNDLVVAIACIFTCSCLADLWAHEGLPFAGRHEDAIVGLEKAIRLNPIAPVWYWTHLGQAYLHAGQYEKALAGRQQGR